VRAQIKIIDPAVVLHMLPFEEHMQILASDKDNLTRCLLLSTDLWVGMVDGKMICFWGLSPSTLLNNSAHLWLYTVEAFKGHEFVFVRKSQRVVEEMLKLYPTITGFTNVHRPKAIRWLKWLGASFGEPIEEEMPFIIGRKQ